MFLYIFYFIISLQVKYMELKMKDIRPIVAAFITIMLIIPAISLKSDTEVQHDDRKYSSMPLEQSLPSLEDDTPIGASTQAFKIFKTSTGKVEDIPAVDYICGVVAAETPASYDMEALKAQAVAAFTYACYHRDYNIAHPRASGSISGADLSDDYYHFEAYISKQQAQSKWGGSFDSNWNKIYSAVIAVKNKVITYGGKPIDAEFFSLSTGITESSVNVWGNSLPYLTPVGSEWDKASPEYKSSFKIKQSDFKAAILAKYKDAKFDKSPSKWLTVKKRSDSGIVLTAELCGKSLNGGDIRSLFKLRSADFEVSFENGDFTFNVKGNGHDVGMSQYGAEYLASQGKKWNEIVSYYYTGVSVSDYIWA